jgi:hypothetical protein
VILGHRTLRREATGRTRRACAGAVPRGREPLPRGMRGEHELVGVPGVGAAVHQGDERERAVRAAAAGRQDQQASPPPTGTRCSWREPVRSVKKNTDAESGAQRGSESAAVPAVSIHGGELPSEAATQSARRSRSPLRPTERRTYATQLPAGGERQRFSGGRQPQDANWCISALRGSGGIRLGS